MKKPTLQQIKETMLSLGMVVFTKPFDATMGAIRTNDNASNKFNDWAFMMMHDDEGNLFGIVEKATTDAGLYYRENPMHIDGTAIIQHGVQHRGAYTYMKEGGHRGQEAFRQTGPMKYWRDADRDQYLDFDGPEEYDIYNTNGHDMGTVGNDVNRWSAGCWGAIQKIMDKFYALAQLQILMGHGSRFSFALLHEKHFS